MTRDQRIAWLVLAVRSGLVKLGRLWRRLGGSNGAGSAGRR
jgi:hypothetical protein